jgi:hypothetical protein
MPRPNPTGRCRDRRIGRRLRLLRRVWRPPSTFVGKNWSFSTEAICAANNIRSAGSQVTRTIWASAWRNGASCANAGAHFQNGFAHEIELERGEMFLPPLIVPLVPRGSEVQVRRLDDIGSYRRAGAAQSRYPIFENIIHNYVQTNRRRARVFLRSRGSSFEDQYPALICLIDTFGIDNEPAYIRYR